MSTGSDAGRTTGPSRATMVAAIVGLLLGAAAAAVGITHIVRDVVHTVSSPVYVLPADIHRHFDSGDIDVFQQTGQRSGSGTFGVSNSGPVTLTPADVTVRAASGAPVPTRYSGTATETLTRGSFVYTNAVRFTVPAAGDYDIHVAAASSGGNTVIVSKSFGAVARDLVPWIGLTAIGGLAGLTSMVVLIVLLVRSSRRRTPAVAQPTMAMPTAPPPGWYPDPGRTATYRWWDGTRWTDHTS